MAIHTPKDLSDYIGTLDQATERARQREASAVAGWLRGLPYSPAFQGWVWQLAYQLFGGYWWALADLIEARVHHDD